MLQLTSSIDIVLIHAVHGIKRGFQLQQDISLHPFILCRPDVYLLSSSSKIKTNKQKKKRKEKKRKTGSSSNNNNKLIQIINIVP